MDGHGMRSDGTSDEQSNRRDANRGRAVVFQRPVSGPAILRQRASELVRQHLLRAKIRRRRRRPRPAPDGGPPPWSGEDGASGHPLMTAAAIREAAANFNNCVAGMWPDAARRNITQENFERFTAGLEPDLRIMDLMDSQPEFTKAIWDYLDILVNDNRLAKGREILAKYKPQFDAAEKAYGVDRYTIASIWGIEFELLDADGRPQRAAIDRDAGLHRPPPGLFQGRIPHRAGNPQPRRSAARADARLLGRRVRADAVHADRVQALRRRRRWRRPPRRRRQRRRPDRLHRQQPQEGRLADRPDLGLRGRAAAGLQLHAGGPRQGDDDRAMGAAGPQARRRQAVPESDREGLSAGAGRRARGRAS